MYIELIIISILSIIICLIQRKKISNILKIEIRGTWFFIAAALIQLAAVLIFKGFKDTKLNKLLLDNYDFITCFTYQFLLIGIIYDLEKDYMKLIFIGTLLNFIVILANDCKMPVLIADEIAGSSINRVFLESDKDLIHTIVNNNTKLRLLCDIITLKKPYPFVKTVSIGDVFLLLGVFGLWQEECGGDSKSKKIAKEG